METSTKTERHPQAAAEDISDRFVELLTARDFERLASLFAPGARARFLLPRGIEEHVGSAAIVGRIESWFGSASQLTLTSSSSDTVGARHRLSWRFSIVRGEQGSEDIEQLAFLDLGPEGIEQLDLLCSGFHSDATAAPNGAIHVFDAGAMGCADGLAQEFRRRLAEVPVGGSISVIVRDPAAKEDLPALARMLGQTVTSMRAHDDGRLEISVGRNK